MTFGGGRQGDGKRAVIREEMEGRRDSRKIVKRKKSAFSRGQGGRAMSTTWTRLLSQRILSWKTENGDHRPPPAKVKLAAFPAEAVRAQEGDLRLRTDTHSRPRAARARLHSGEPLLWVRRPARTGAEAAEGPASPRTRSPARGRLDRLPRARGASRPVRRRSTPPGRLSPAWEEPELAPRGQQTSPRDRVFVFVFHFYLALCCSCLVAQSCTTLL